MPRLGTRERLVARTPAIVPRLLVAMALVTPSACSCNGDGTSRAPSGAEPGVGAGEQTLPVGNPARGYEAQPDYDAQAAELRERVASRLPQPLPTVHEACTQMLAAAADHYARTESDARGPLTVLAAGHAADLAACERETSAAAASCVALLSAEDAGELPWLLDQCTRAFP